MSANVILKDEVIDILDALRMTSAEYLLSGNHSADQVAFVKGYHAALDAVTRALGATPASSLSVRDTPRREFEPGIPRLPAGSRRA